MEDARPGAETGVGSPWEILKLWTLRTVQSDFLKVHVTDSERERLLHAHAPVTSDLVQRYAVWRWGALWMACGLLAATLVFQLVDVVETLSTSADDLLGAMNLPPRAYALSGWGFVQTLYVAVFLLRVAAFVLVVRAARCWTDVLRSRSRARLGWIISFGAPLILVVVPLRSVLSIEARGFAVDQGTAAALAGMGAILGLAAVVLILPPIVGFFSGTIRSALTVKTLLPESTSPGWVTVLTAPPFALLLLFFLAVVNQLGGSLVLTFGMLFVILGVVNYMWQARVVFAPHGSDVTESLVVRVRRRSVAATLVGLLFIAVWALDTAALGVDDVLHLFVATGASILVLTVVGADFAVAIFARAHRQAREQEGGDLERSLLAKLDDLDAAGLTGFRPRDG